MNTSQTSEQLLDYSDDDECNACAAVDGQCPYHRGYAAGVAAAVNHLREWSDRS